jgi:two-component system, NarL family, nitrate/nitrite response regulator NarL
MSSRASPQAGKGKTQYETVAPDLLDDLIRQLVQYLGHRKPSNDPSVSEEVILDYNIDEVRYLVVRMPAVTLAHCPLSPREKEIVRMVADGRPTKVIAGVLNISCWTVSAHLRRIFAKLGVTSRPAMVARLLEEGRTWDVQFHWNDVPAQCAASEVTPSQRPSNATRAHAPGVSSTVGGTRAADA